jgi:hypothetical protein
MESASSALVGGQVKSVKFNSRLRHPNGDAVPLTELHSITIKMEDGAEVIVTPSFGSRSGRVPKSYGGLMVMKISSQNVRALTRARKEGE